MSITKTAVFQWIKGSTNVLVRVAGLDGTLVQTGITCTETSSGVSGVFTCSITSAVASSLTTYFFDGYDSGTGKQLFDRAIDLTEAVGTYYAQEMPTVLMVANGSGLSAAVTAIESAITSGLAGLGANITVVSPLSSDGTKLHITQGDSYTSAMSNSISFNITNQTGLIGAIPHLRFDGSSTDFAVAPVITSGTQAVTFNDITTATTQALTPGTNIRYQIRFVNGSNKYTPIGGVAIINKGL